MAELGAQQAIDGLLQHPLLRRMLLNNHCGTQRSCAGGIGILMLICRLGEGHQHCGSAADREFAEAPGSSAADGQVGMLQQRRNLIAEAAFHQLWVLQLPKVRVVVAGEVNHAAALLQQGRHRSTHHAVEADGALTIERDITVDDMSEYQPHQVRKKQLAGLRHEAIDRAGRIRPHTARLRVNELGAEQPVEVRSGEVNATMERIDAGRATFPRPS